MDRRIALYFLLAEVLYCMAGGILGNGDIDKETSAAVVTPTMDKKVNSSDTNASMPPKLSFDDRDNQGYSNVTQPSQVSTDGQKANTNHTGGTSGMKLNRNDVTSPLKKGVEPMPPSITFPETSKTIIVKASNKDDYSLKCQGNGNPEPRYEWYRDGIKVTESGTYIQGLSDGTLHFPDFSNRENGWYQCVAINQFGKSLSNVFFLVRETESLDVEEHSNPTTLKMWEPYSVACAGVPVTYPSVKVRWYKKGNNQIRLDKRTGQDEEGTLHLAYVTADDNERVFRCALTLTSTIWTAEMGKLRVTDTRTGQVDKKPTMQYVTEKVEANIGEDIILDCFIAGIPVVAITWKNSSNQVINKDQNSRFEIFDYGRKLKVKRVNFFDEGNFSCAGNNIAGTVEARISVNVTGPPRAVKGGALTSRTVPDGTDFTLNCKTQAAPQESVNTPKWYRNGEPLTQGTVPDRRRYKFNSDMTALTISELDKEKDTACFQCNVTNSKGYIYFDSYLRVINSIKILSQPEAVITIEEDDVIDLTIRSVGDRCCTNTYSWYFDSDQINVNEPPFQSNATTNALYFDAGSVPLDVLKTKLGAYKCRVSNYYQSVYVDVEIQLKKDKMATTTKTPEPLTASKASTGLWWVGLICGLVVVFIATAIVLVIVYKRKNPGETYALEKQELKHNLNPEEDLMNQSFQEI